MAGLMERGEHAGIDENKGQVWAYRGFNAARDLPAVVSLINEVEAADGTERGTSGEEMRQFMRRPGLEPGRDWLVVDHPGEPGRLIALARLFKSGTDPSARLHLQVHPAWRRRGIGSTLLDALLARGRELGAEGFGVWAGDSVPDGIDLLERAGFQRTVTWLEMRMEAETPVGPIEWPQGFSVKSYDQVRDPEVLRTASNRGFIGHYDHHDETLAEVEHWLALDMMRHDGIFLAFDEQGEPAGFCAAMINERRIQRLGEARGYIDGLAVVPEHRRRGLGRALLLQGVSWLRDNGMGPVTLQVYGENELAMPLYTDAGFHPNRRNYEYRLER